MFPNRLVIVFVGLGCTAAAGVGAYVATRQNLANLAAPAVTAAVVPQTAAVTLSPPGAPVAPTSVQPPLESPTAAELVPAAAPLRASNTVPGTATLPTAAESRSMRIAEEPAVVERPSGPPVPVAAPPMAAAEPLLAPPVEETRIAEAPAQSEASTARALHELVVQPDSVIGLETESALTSERARLEDRVEARVVRDVRVNGAIAVPAGTKALGTVVVVDRGGKVRERARLGIRFQTLLLPDGTRLPISTETIYRYGEAPGDRAAAKITGGVVAGAILGALINGGKGAAIGAAAGAGAGTAAVASAERNAAQFPAGAEVTARILAPITVTLDK
jgi:hypothetical protein